MKINRLLLVLLFAAFFQSTAHAQTLISDRPVTESYFFLENKGQVLYPDGQPARDIKYIYSAPGFKLLLKENSFSYEVYTLEKSEDLRRHPVPQNSINSKFLTANRNTVYSHRVDITLPGAYAHPQMVAENRRSAYKNFYRGSDKTNPAIGSFEKITYKNIYPNVDFVFYSGEKTGIKYDIIVHPGGRLQDVKMAYAGLQGLGEQKADPELEQGRLFLPTSLGALIETIPYSYIRESKEKVTVNYEIKGDTVSFQTDEYPGQTLVIDPTLTWGTYKGGEGDEEIFDMILDKSGNIYVTGYTSSISNIATAGAYRDTFSGATDAFLSKFNSSGGIQWSTYFGGIDEDQAYGVAADTTGNVIITGYTYNAGLASTGSHQAAHGGEVDAFIAKFSSAGALIWCTYYGDTEFDYGYSVATDRSGNVYAGGYTSSASGIATSGAHKTSILPDDVDAYLVKFNSSGARQWGSYFGGDDVDVALLGLAVDGSGNVHIAGLTYSTTDIATSGAHQTTLGGDADAFAARFNSSGVLQWGTYYGDADEDYAYDIALDASGNIFVTGYTLSTSGIATSGAFKTSHGGDYDAYLVKFNSSGTRQWGTYYGNTLTDAAFSVATDASGNVYISGTTQSTSGIATSGTHQTTHAGEFDSYLVKFNSGGQRQWGTYYGGDGDEQAYSLGLDASRNVYIAGSTTSSTSGIATNGSHQDTFGGSFYDAFLAKFTPVLVDAGVFSVTSPGTLICPGMHNTTIRIRNYGNVSLDSVRVGWSVNGVAQAPFKRTGTLKSGDTSSSFSIGTASYSGGVNVVKIWTFRPNGTADANLQNDTHKINIQAWPLPVARFSMAKSCSGEAAKFTNSSSISAGTITAYSWRFGDGSTSTDANPSHIFSSSGSFDIVLTTTSDKGCRDSIKHRVTIHPMPVPAFTAATGCAQGGTSFSNTTTISGGAISYAWDFDDGTGSTDKDPVHVFVSAGTYNVKLTAISDSGCTSSLSKTVTVTSNPAPTVKFSAQDGCSSSIDFTNESTVSSGTISGYKWTFGDGNSSTVADPLHTFPGPGTYTVTLQAVTNNGCTNSYSRNITVFPTPKADFIAAQACAGSGLSFKDNSTNAGGSISSYKWTFGDGDSSEAQNPDHVYSKAGTYTVSLTIISDKGCSGQVSRSIIINPLPSSGFTFLPAGRAVAFSADETTHSSYIWHFGDGDSANTATANHTYASDGTYPVKLTVISSKGCRTSTTISVSVAATGMGENPGERRFIVYPNPVYARYLFMEGNAEITQGHVQLRDVLGRSVPVLIEKQNGRYRLRLPESLAAGLYYLTIMNDGTHKVMIQ